MLLNPMEYGRMMTVYETLDVKRWHKEKLPAQTTSDHSAKMAILCLALHPKPSAELLAAIVLHDAEEWFTGDFPSHVKENFPVLREIEEEAREEFFEVSQITNPFTKLSEDDKLWLSFLDKIEVLAYIDSNVGRENIHAEEIFDRQMAAALELEKQLQARGFLTEPDNQIH